MGRTKTEQKNLLVAATTEKVSEWINVADADEISIDVHGLELGDIVQIEGSNASLLSNAVGVQVGDDITADGFYTPSAIPRWLRANYADASGGGPVTVLLSAKGDW